MNLLFLINQIFNMMLHFLCHLKNCEQDTHSLFHAAVASSNCSQTTSSPLQGIAPLAGADLKSVPPAGADL